MSEPTLREYEAWVAALKKEARTKFLSVASAARHYGVSETAMRRILSGERSGMRLFLRLRNES